jgi:hypothetical protein
MVSVFINHTHHTRNDAALTGVHFTVNYRGKQAQVSILGMPPLAETEQIEAVQQVLRDLADDPPSPCGSDCPSGGQVFRAA